VDTPGVDIEENPLDLLSWLRKVKTHILSLSGFKFELINAGLWIRIDLIRIRIQHFCSIRIRIQAKTELSKTISFSNIFKIKI
jgi:hypothetical protein